MRQKKSWRYYSQKIKLSDHHFVIVGKPDKFTSVTGAKKFIRELEALIRQRPIQSNAKHLKKRKPRI